MIEFFGALFLILGAALIFIAALGTFRFPDLYTRMHAVSKATSLGLGSMLLGTALAFPTPAVILKIIAVLLFLFLTAPIAAHMIGRAAHLCKIPL